MTLLTIGLGQIPNRLSWRWGALLLSLVLSGCLHDGEGEKAEPGVNATGLPVVDIYFEESTINDLGFRPIIDPDQYGDYHFDEAELDSNGNWGPRTVNLVFSLDDPPVSDAQFGIQILGKGAPGAVGATGTYGEAPRLGDPGWPNENSAAEFADVMFVNLDSPDLVIMQGNTAYIRFPSTGPHAQDNENGKVVRRLSVVFHHDRLYEQPNFSVDGTTPPVPEMVWLVAGQEKNIRMPASFGSDKAKRIFINDKDPKPEIQFGLLNPLDTTNYTTLPQVSETLGSIPLQLKLVDPFNPNATENNQRIWHDNDIQISCQGDQTQTAKPDSNGIDYDYIVPCPAVLPAFTNKTKVDLLLQDDVLVTEGIETAVVNMTGALSTRNSTFALVKHDASNGNVSFTITDDDASLNLKDTAVTECSTELKWKVSCAEAAADGFPTNQDGASDTPAVYTFQPPGGPTVDTCAVIDNTTGLMWEFKKPDNELYLSDPQYLLSGFTWYDPFENRNGGGEGNTGDESENGPKSCNLGTACNTQEYVNWANSTALCGYTNWRLPKVSELLSIVEYDYNGSVAGGASNAAIDLLAFPETIPQKYWTSTAVAGDKKQAWVVDFQEGTTLPYSKVDVSIQAAIRLVRTN